MLTADNVKETTRSTGTGPVHLRGPAAPHFSTFAAAFAVGTRDIAYFIVDLSGENFEWGSGTLVAIDELSRDHVLGSANAGMPVSFSAGIKHVLVAQPGGSLADFDTRWRPRPDAGLERSS